MFIDTECVAASIHSYSDMYDLLKGLKESYPSDVEIFSAGKSEGFGGAENALDVWGINIMATQETKQTIFLVGGHHPEFSGPETAYLVAERLMQSHYSNNANVWRLRENTHITVFPQVNVDLYDNLEFYDHDHPSTFWKTGFGEVTYMEMGEKKTRLKNFETNYYGAERQYIIDSGFPPPKQSIAVKKAVERIIAEYGKPILSFDYHEDRFGEFSMIDQISPEGIEVKGYQDSWAESDEGLRAFQYDLPYIWDFVDEPTIETFSLPFYALEEIAKVSPGQIRSDPDLLSTLRAYGFCEFLATNGAESFTFEAQRSLPLEERIRINLTGTDRILARHILGI